MDSGLYIKKGTTINESGFVIYGNYLNQYKESGSCIKIYNSSSQEIDSYNIQANKAISEVVILECNNKKLIRSCINFEDEDKNIILNLDHVVFGFDLQESENNIVAGYYSGLPKNKEIQSTLITHNSNEPKYEIQIKNDNSIKNEIFQLPFDAITGATSFDNEFFFFGADKKVIKMKLGI